MGRTDQEGASRDRKMSSQALKGHSHPHRAWRGPDRRDCKKSAAQLPRVDVCLGVRGEGAKTVPFTKIMGWEGAEGSDAFKSLQIHKDTGTPMLTAALFTIDKTWKQPKCPSPEEWIKKMWCIYTMEYYSAMKMNEMMLFAATWMQLESIILSEVGERKTNISWYHLYVESKIGHNWTYLWNRNRLTDIESRPAIAKAVGVGGWYKRLRLADESFCI